MQINRIVFENFRPFYGSVDIDLTTDNDKNIILIGGKNGHGKTNFLLGIVWCLYGEMISKVDDSFKAEITNNYPKFLDGVLNKDKKAEAEGYKEFSVELNFSDVAYGDDSYSSIIIKRSYNTESQDEKLSISSINDELLLAISTDEERQSFINDYLVPMEIARFVFFDAEKISQIADLSAGKQAELMNKTLGNMLGLNIYQNLLNEIKAYIRKLKKESSTAEVKEQITNIENSIKSHNQTINTKEIDLQEKTNEEAKVSSKIQELEIQINRKGGNNINIENLHKKRGDLEIQRREMQVKFNEIADVIPLFMLSGVLQETKEHIEIEENNRDNKATQSNFTEKVELFIEELFNKGDMPSPDINLKQKIFYEEKSTKLVNCFVDDNQQKESLAFKHNLDHSKIKDLQDLYNNTQSKSNTDLMNIITSFSAKKEECSKLDGEIKKLELTSADDLTKSLIGSKNNFQNKKDDLNKIIGSLENDISRAESEISTNEKRLSVLYDKSKTNKKNQEKVELSERYIEVLNDFIKEEKEEKKEAIKDKLLLELNTLWHKQLISNAKLFILPDDKGMEVELLDKDNKPIQSKELSKGEQQIYISALLKSILDSSIHSLPVFIDTPLARLDSEHRDNILENYYPNLSTQVVVFSTDTEITSLEHTKIEQHIAKNYLIENIDGKSNINEGYFN